MSFSKTDVATLLGAAMLGSGAKDLGKWGYNWKYGQKPVGKKEMAIQTDG